MIAKTFTAILVAVALGVASLPAVAQEDLPFTPKQAEGIRKIVKDYLVEHPEVITQAIEALREKARLQEEADAKKAIEAYKDELLNGKDDPTFGNPKGDVVIVEFFDYNCGYCKQSMDGLFEAVKADGKTKLVFKEFPILTDDSITAARVALAAKKMGKYEDVHRAFMKYRGRLDEKAVYRIVGELGLNVDQIKKDSGSAEIEKQIRRTKEIAHALGLDGTPSFVVGDRLLSGGQEQQTFKQLFDSTRKAAKVPQ